MNVAYIGVGSNINAEKNIAAALQKLCDYVGVMAVSSFYRTPAIDRPDQDDYLNGIFEVRTAMLPDELKSGVLRRIEDELNRIRTHDAFDARTIDLDIVLYGDVIDPDLYKRPFIAYPLYELAPEIVLSDTGMSLKEIVSRMSNDRMEKDVAFSKKLKTRLHEVSSGCIRLRKKNRKVCDGRESP